MRLALANAYPAELGLLSQALGLPYRKDPKAVKALREVSRPRKKGGGWDENPAKLELVHQRCVTDVAATRAVWTASRSTASRPTRAPSATPRRRDQPPRRAHRSRPLSPPPATSPPMNVTLSTSGCSS